MKKLILILTALCAAILLLESCKPTVLDLNKYADKIEAQLKGKPYGYAFVITKLGQPRVQRAWGEARRKADPPEMPMSVNVKYTTASVSKNITAAAFLKLLDDTNIKNKNLTLDEKLNEKMVDYLPYYWKPGAGVNSITFREMLKHRTGIHCDPDFVDYRNLRKCLAKGIDTADKDRTCPTADGPGQPIGTNDNGCYKNANYALFRIVIPVMMGKVVKPVLSTFTEEQKDAETEILTSNVYINYVNDNVYAKAGLPKIFCKPTDGKQQGLAYKHAAPDAKGGDFGDATFECGSQGWFLSAAQLATYFETLNTTDKIVLPAISSRMRTEYLGYDGGGGFDTPDGKITYWSKPGGHPAAQNTGEINTLLMHFSNGVEVSVVINSDFKPPVDWGGVIINSLSDLLNGK